jgi:plastocyanin
MSKSPSVFRSAVVALALLGAGSLPAGAGDSHSAAPAPARVVKLSGLGFVPATLTVHPRDSIMWSNDDLIVHTVTAADHSFDSGDLAGGKSWSFIARKKGTFPYACRYHPNMTGTLIVR